MSGSLQVIATVKGVVDLVTGVWDQGGKEYHEGNAGGIDVTSRHCKEAYNILRGPGFKLGGELSTIEMPNASNTGRAPYIINLYGVRVSNCLVGRR